MGGSQTALSGPRHALVKLPALRYLRQEPFAKRAVSSGLRSSFHDMILASLTNHSSPSSPVRLAGSGGSSD